MADQVRIPSHKVVYTDEEIELAKKALEEIMRSGWMVLGKKTQEFEEAYAKLHGRKYAVAVSSDTAALEICLRIAGIGEGDKVAFPANGFAGVVMPIIRVGATPIFFDIDQEENLFATPDRIEALLDEHPDLKCLILSHCGGLVASRSEEIAKLCKDRGVEVIEEAAHAPGATMNGKHAGSFGRAAVLSLYATKPINAGEGGIILTDDAELAEKAKVYRNYGRAKSFGMSVLIYPGDSWRLTEIQAAIGIEQVRRQAIIDEERHMLANRYHDLIKPLKDRGIFPYEPAEGTRPNWYRYLMKLPRGWNHEMRQELKAYAREHYGVDIPGEVYEVPVCDMPIWKDKFHASFPNAEDWCARNIALPIWNTMTLEEQQIVVKAVAEGFDKVSAVYKG